MMSPVAEWLTTTPVMLAGAVILLLMTVAGYVGQRLRAQNDRADRSRGSGGLESHEGYLVSAVLSLLALLTGFTFSLAVDRFETRRALVLDEANAIGTAYLRSQLLEEPHRARISGLLISYTDNRVTLAHSNSRNERAALLADNDRIITDLWVATVAAFPTIREDDFSSAYIDSINAVIDLDSARKAARLVRIPAEVFIVLIIYMIVTAAVMGYVLTGPRGRATGVFLMMLTTMSLMLVIDIDRPDRGGIRESQGPMEWLRESMRANPPRSYDRLMPDSGAPPGPTALPTGG